MFGRKFRGSSVSQPPTPENVPGQMPSGDNKVLIQKGVAEPSVPANKIAPGTLPQPTAKAPNLSDAIGQLKAGNKFDAQNTMRKTVGLSEIAPPPAIEKPQLSDAIGRLKMGDRASAEAMMRKMVGLKKGGKVSKSSKGSSSSSASRRGDGIASKGKTKGRMV